MRSGTPENRDEYVRKHGSERFPKLYFRKFLGRLQRSFPSARLRRTAAGWMGVRLPQPSGEDRPPFIGLEVWLDDTFPELITIEPGAVLAVRAAIMAHDDATRTVSPVVISSGAYVGVGAIILPGVTIGAKATVGAGAVVTHDVPPGETWVGVPARKLGKDQDS